MDELRFTYTEADYLQASKLHMRQGKRRYLPGALVVLSFLLALLILDQTRSPQYAIAAFLLPVSVLFIITNLLLPLMVKKRMKEMRPLREEVEMRFFEDHIEMDTSAGSGSYKWLLRVVESSDMLLLMVNQLSFVMVPRRICADDAQFERIAAVGKKLAEQPANQK